MFMYFVCWGPICSIAYLVGAYGAVGAEWPAYPQASYANQSKSDV